MPDAALVRNEPALRTAHDSRGVSAGNRERRDVDPRVIVAFAAGLVAFIVLALLALRLIFGVPPPPVPFNSGTGLDPARETVLQTNPVADRTAYDAEKQAELNGLGWTDKAAGIAHIPIADAMKIIAARGSFPAAASQSATAPGTANVRSGECALLEANVPRAPQAAPCPPAAASSTGAGR